MLAICMIGKALRGKLADTWQEYQHIFEGHAADPARNPSDYQDPQQQSISRLFRWRLEVMLDAQGARLQRDMRVAVAMLGLMQPQIPLPMYFLKLVFETLGGFCEQRGFANAIATLVDAHYISFCSSSECSVEMHSLVGLFLAGKLLDAEAGANAALHQSCPGLTTDSETLQLLHQIWTRGSALVHPATYPCIFSGLSLPTIL